MNICITNESAQYFGSFFERIAETSLDSKLNSKAVIESIFNTAFEILKDSGESSKVKELLLQHLPLAVPMILKETFKNPKLGSAAYVMEMIDLNQRVLGALTDTESYQALLNEFSDYVKSRPQVVPYIEDVRFNAVSLEFARTTTQTSIFEPQFGYKRNITDVEKLYQQKATIELLNSNNLNFKLVSVSEVKENSDFNLLYDVSDVDFVLAPVDIKGEYYKIDGRIPTFTFKQTKESLAETIKVKATYEFNKAKQSDSNAEYQTYLDQIEKEADSYVELIKYQLEKARSGKTVILDINHAGSSFGVIEMNRNVSHKVNQISNVTSADLIMEVLDKRPNFFIQVPNSNNKVRLFEDSWMNMSNSEFESLHYLLTNSNPEIAIVKPDGSIGKAFDKSEKETNRLLKPFISSKYVKLDREANTIALMGTVYDLSSLTVEDLKRASLNRDLDPLVSPEQLKASANVSILNNSNELTQIGQWYRDSNGDVREAVGIRKSFGFAKSLSSPTRSINRLENGKLLLNYDKPFVEYLLENSYVSVQLTGDNQLKAGGAYLAFTIRQDLNVAAEELFFSEPTQKLQNFLATDFDNANATEWFANSPLSRVLKVVYHEGFHAKGPQYLASFIGKTLNMFQGSEPVLLYHEAFHAFFNGVLSEQERTEIYSELQNLNGSFKVVVNGSLKTVNFKDATNLELEEYMAEEFRAYATEQSRAVKSSKLKALFDKILDYLKSFFNGASYSDIVSLGKSQEVTNALFEQLYSGNFSVENFQSESSDFEKYASFEKNGKRLSIQDTNLLIESFNALASFIVSDVYSFQSSKEGLNQALGIMRDMMINSGDTVKLEALQKSLSNYNGVLPQGGTISKLTNPAYVSAIGQIFKKVLEAKLQSGGSEYNQEVLRTALSDEFFGDPTRVVEFMQESEPSSLISLLYSSSPFLQSLSLDWNKMSALDLDNELALEENEVFVLGADQYNNNVSENDTLEGLTKVLLSTVPEYSEQGRGVMAVNRLGLPKLRTLNAMRFKIQTLLNGANGVEEMNALLQEAAKTDKEVAYVYKMLGDIYTAADQELWNDFEQSFNKIYTPLRTVVATKTKKYIKDLSQEVEEKYDEDNNLIPSEISEVLESSELKITTGQIGQDRQQVISDWRSGFNYMLQSEGPYVEYDEAGMPYFNLEYFLHDYTMAEDRKYLKRSGNGPKLTDSVIGFGSQNYTSKLTKAEWDMFEFFKEIGINLADDPRILFGVLNGDPSLGTPGGIVRFLLEHFKNKSSEVFKRENGHSPVTNPNRIYKLDDLFKSILYKSESNQILESNQSNVLTQLSKMHYAYSNDAGTFMGYNAAGNKQNQMSYPSSLYSMIRILNSASSYDELISIPGFEHLNMDTNVQAECYPWLRYMFNLSNPSSPVYGQRNYQYSFNVELLGGSKYVEEKISAAQLKTSDDVGVESMASDEITKFITDIALTLDVRQETPRAEAKNTSTTVSAPTFKKSNSEFRDLNSLALNKTEAKALESENYSGSLMNDLFFDHLAAELVRITEVKNAQKLENLKFDAAFLNRGVDFSFFDDILTPEFKQTLLDLNVEIYAELEEAFEDSPNLQMEFEKQMKDYFIKRRNELASNKFKVAYPEFLLDRVKITESEDEEVLTNRLLLTFLINNTYNNLNYTSLFLGDFSNYNVAGEDFHKRIAGLISTGKGFRYDNVWLDYINQQAYGFAEKHLSENNLDRNKSKLAYDGTLNSVILDEKVTESVYAKYYSDLLGIPISEYVKMNEADGSGYLSFDAYRILCKSSNEWSKEQENIYQKLLKNETIEAHEMTTFPPKKFQYYGPVQGASSDVRLSLMSFHKYSLIPLIPTLIKNTPLEKLHNKMMEQGIDYATFKSGSKLTDVVPVTFENGIWKNQFDSFYKNDRSVDESITFTKNVLHVRYLKNQLHIAEGYKGKITLPTQIRKIILLGLFDNGIPTDYSGDKVWSSLTHEQKLKESKNYNWFNRYLNNLNALSSHYKSELLQSLGASLNPDTGLYEGDSNKLISYLKSALEDKDLTKDEIDSLIDPATGELISDLSFSLHSSAIEKMLVTLVDKKLRRLKINGEALVQVSGAMYEQLGLDPVQDLSGKLRYGSNQLRFYHLIDENGNPVESKDDLGNAVAVSEMEVMISLQGDYNKLLNLKHNDGKPIKTFTDGKYDYNKSLDRLNEMLADETFSKKYHNLLVLPGIRIPTQGPNSLSIPKVKKFLPEYAGPVIVLPVEIVAQSGSDFDIDKIFAMMKNLNVYDDKVEEIKYSPTADDLYEVKQQIKQLNSELSDLKIQRKEALKQALNSKDSQNKLKSNNEELYNTISVLKLSLKTASSVKKAEKIQKNIDELYDDINSNLLNYFGMDLSKEERREVMRSELGQYWDEYTRIETLIKNATDAKTKLIRILDGNSVKGLENEFMSLIHERGTMVSNFKALVTANTTDDAKGMADSILNEKVAQEGTYDKRVKRNSKSAGITATEAMMYEYNLYKHQENSVGKDSLGIAAVVSTFHAMFTTIGGKLEANDSEVEAKATKAKEFIATYSKLDQKDKMLQRPKYEEAIKTLSEYIPKYFNLRSNKDENGNVFLGGQFDANDNPHEISDTISQLINGYVDVAKDAWIFLIEGSKENTPVLLAMILAGVPLQDAVRMSVHPLVKLYTESKQLMKGPYAGLNDDVSIYKASEIKSLSQKKLYDYYASKHFNDIGFSTINALNSVPFTLSELEEMSKNQTGQYSPRDIEVLAQYIHIEKMADEMTTLTNLLKFDTKKVASINEAQLRINNTNDYRKLSVNQKFFGNTFLDKLDRSPVSPFNNDNLLVHLFDKQFAVRNNSVLTELSLGITNKILPKGADLATVRQHYKNDFVLFLYQNSVYSNDQVSVVTKDGQIKTIKFEEHSNPEFKVDDSTIKYHPILSMLNEVVKQEWSHVRHFFMAKGNTQTKNFMSFLANYNQLYEDTADMTANELSEKYYYLDRPAGNLREMFTSDEAYRRVLLQRVAMFNSRNPESMFDADMGVSTIIKHFLSKYPELQNYKLIQDMKWDYNKSQNRYNMYFSNMSSDPELVKTYRENLKELENFHAPEVRLVFNENYFTHMGIMQTGLARNVKHDIARIGNPSHLQNELISSPKFKSILNTLEQVKVNMSELKKGSVKETSYLMLDQFDQLYKKMLKNNLYYSRYNGMNYTVSNLETVAAVNSKSNLLDFKVEIVSAQDALLTTQDFLDNQKNLEDYINALSESNGLSIQSDYIEMPTSKSQKLLDKLLDSKLNLKNSYQGITQIKRVSGLGIDNGLNIGSVLEALKSKSTEERYSVMALNSTKMIGVSVKPLNPNYKGSIETLMSLAEKDPGLKSKLNPKKILQSDTVFIFGDSIVEAAFSGYTKEEYQVNLRNAFDSLQNQLRAVVKAGATVNISTLNGVDEMVRDYLQNRNYVKQTIYKGTVKYYSYKPVDSVSNIELFTTDDISFSAHPLNNVVRLIKTQKGFKEIEAKIKQMESFPEKLATLEKAFVSFMAQMNLTNGRGRQSYSDYIKSELIRLSQNVELGSGEINVLFEQLFLDYADRLQKTAAKNKARNSIQKLLVSYENQTPTFEQLPIDNASKDRVIEFNMKAYPESFPTKESVIEAINEYLAKDLEGTIEQIFKCL